MTAPEHGNTAGDADPFDQMDSAFVALKLTCAEAESHALREARCASSPAALKLWDLYAQRWRSRRLAVDLWEVSDKAVKL
jgi:hypothetical protein